MKIIDTTTYFEEKLTMNLRFNILNSYGGTISLHQ